MNCSYDLCGILLGIRTTHDQPRFHAVKDAAGQQLQQNPVFRHFAMLGFSGTLDMLLSNKF